MKVKTNKNIVYPVALVLIAAGAFFYRYFALGINDDPVVISHATSNGRNSAESETTIQQDLQESESSITAISVYICGAVNIPGVYEVQQGMIVNDVLQMAGGFSDIADRNSINLVYIISSNITVYVPAIGEEDYPAGDYLLRTSVRDVVDYQPSDLSMVNINTATVQQLMSLPGIGESLANAIIEYRENSGPFTSVEGIMNVSGIGQSKFDRIRELICV